MRYVLIVAAVLAIVVLLGWLGLQVRPRPFSPYPERTPELETVPLPAGLPAPVERYMRMVYGDRVPVIETVVIKGRAAISPFSVTMLSRFIFVHNTGDDYRHYFEATLFGLPILRINEHYVDGESYFELPVGTLENDPSISQGANLALWAEAAWFPAIWVTDPRARWEPVDENTALLYVPFGEEEEQFVVRFDPETGMLDMMEAMRYRDAGPEAEKILWITQTVPGETIEGTNIPATGFATWLDQGKPWAVFTMEDLVYNVDVREYIRQRGP